LDSTVCVEKLTVERKIHALNFLIPRCYKSK
jgi:hypothetical protein